MFLFFFCDCFGFGLLTDINIENNSKTGLKTFRILKNCQENTQVQGGKGKREVTETELSAYMARTKTEDLEKETKNRGEVEKNLIEGEISKVCSLQKLILLTH